LPQPTPEYLVIVEEEYADPARRQGLLTHR
jgi:hypothetical protein